MVLLSQRQGLAFRGSAGLRVSCTARTSHLSYILCIVGHGCTIDTVEKRERTPDLRRTLLVRLPSCDLVHGGTSSEPR
jgi:hypothetical protein